MLPASSAVPVCSEGGDSATCADMAPGRMSHTAFHGGGSGVMRGGFVGTSDAAVYVFGGYGGVVRGDLLALTVSSPTPTTCVSARCAAYTGCWACARDVACGWDAPTAACVGVGGGVAGGVVVDVVVCPGNSSAAVAVGTTGDDGAHGVLAATWYAPMVHSFAGCCLGSCSEEYIVHHVAPLVVTN